MLIPLVSYADPFGYNKEIELKVESENLIVFHYHNWSSSTRGSRFKMISTHQNPFKPSNDYAYILCIDKATKDTLFQNPCPAMSQIQISKDENYIVGISNIKLWNPYQFVLFRTSGELIKKLHIADKEAKLSVEKTTNFKLKFPKQYAFLDSLGRIKKVDKSYYIDFLSMGMPKKLGEAWSYLYDFIDSHHLSPNFSSSITNWTLWYFESKPDLQFVYDNQELIGISLLDPKKKRGASLVCLEKGKKK